MTTQFPFAASYLDRNGKTRWRFSLGKTVVQLPGDPAKTIENRIFYLEVADELNVSAMVTEPFRPLIRPEQIAHLHFSQWVIHARKRRKSRGLSFDLTPDYLTFLCVEQNFKCSVSNIQLEFKTAGRRSYRRYPFVASVDRIDNDKGYEPDNVRIVCLIVNLARSDFGDGALIKMAKAIAGMS